MAKTNGKSEMKSRDLDIEHELPAAEADGTLSATENASPESESGELQKLRSERDALIDRLARSQAEFDNARKRAAREQQEYRDYASAEAIKSYAAKHDMLTMAEDGVLKAFSGLTTLDEVIRVTR